MTFLGRTVCHELSKLDCTKGDDEKGKEKLRPRRFATVFFCVGKVLFTVHHFLPSGFLFNTK